MPGQVSFMTGEVEIGLAAYQSLWTWLRDADETVRVSIPLAARAVREKFPRPGPAPTEDQIQELLRAQSPTKDDSPSVKFFSSYATRALARHYPEPTKSMD